MRHLATLMRYFLLLVSLGVWTAPAHSTPKADMAQHTEDLRALMLALYEAHPEELAKSTQVGVREMTEWVFEGKANWRFDAIRRQQGAEAMALLFESGYAGDRVLPLVVGLETLLFHAYGASNEFDIPTAVSAQALQQADCQLQHFVQTLQTRVAEGGQPAASLLGNPKVIRHIDLTVQRLMQRLQSSAKRRLNC